MTVQLSAIPYPPPSVRAGLLPRAAAVLAILAGVGCGGQSLEPHGEAVLTLHTDMPVPRIISALRVDLYDADGWYESRDVPTPRADSWPLSFSLISRKLDRETETLVRLRAYPDLHLRDYRGERYEPMLGYEPPRAPASLDQICGGSEFFVPPARFDLRRGDAPGITQTDCVPGNYGVTGARIRIERAGSYRFEIFDTYPRTSTYVKAEPQLFLRSSCANASAELECGEPSGGAGLPGIVRHLEPGDYGLFVASGPGDLHDLDYRVRVALEGDWESATSEDELPQLVLEGRNLTPFYEPEPAVTIDRLLHVRLAPGEVRQLDVVLRGECAGTMAKLFEGTPRSEIDFEDARTCVHTEKDRLSVEQAPIDDGPVDAESIGTFATTTDCENEPEDPDLVCVPSGALLLGDPHSAGLLPPRRSVPERIARIRRFWLDRNEVTVARYRAALDDGLIVPDKENLTRNKDPFPKTLKGASDHSFPVCAFSDAPLAPPNDREEYAITCISWSAARDFCRFAGGDLPTEAQWEHAATSAGRPAREVTYPWEEDEPEPPSCSRAWCGRLGDPAELSDFQNFWPELGATYSEECITRVETVAPGKTLGFGAAPVSARHDSDRTPLGVIGMAGGVSEWVLDAAYPYEHECWRAAPLDDPACLMDRATLRGVRGGSWVHATTSLKAATRAFADSSTLGAWPPAYLGFRCAYTERPGGTAGEP
jgi:formylglycine-generating enzyme required for sulfatase activity